MGSAGSAITRVLCFSAWLVATAFTATCSDPPAAVPPVLGGEGAYEGTFLVPERTAIASAIRDLPLAPSGPGHVFFAIPTIGQAIIDPTYRTPLSAAAECADLVLACLSPPARDLLGCLQNVQPCSTETPWVGDAPFCCPRACVDRYVALRKEGQPPQLAFAFALWKEPSCAPGVDAMRRGEP